MPKKKTRIIQVPMPEDLVEKLDKLSYDMGESRSFVLREAAAKYITDAKEAEGVRRYVEYYTDNPEKVDSAEAEERLKNAFAVWGDEDWSDEYEAWLAENNEAR